MGLTADLCAYCGHNPPVIEVDDRLYCSADCYTDEYRARCRAKRREGQS